MLKSSNDSLFRDETRTGYEKLMYCRYQNTFYRKKLKIGDIAIKMDDSFTNLTDGILHVIKHGSTDPDVSCECIIETVMSVCAGTRVAETIGHIRDVFANWICKKSRALFRQKICEFLFSTFIYSF